MIKTNKDQPIPTLTWTDVLNGKRMYDLISQKFRKCERKGDFVRAKKYKVLRAQFVEAPRLFQRGKEKCLLNGDIRE